MSGRDCQPASQPWDQACIALHRANIPVTGAQHLHCLLLRSAIVGACGRLVALSGQLLADWRRSAPQTSLARAAMLRCSLACATLFVCSAACASSASTGPLFRCAALALGPGAAMLESIAAGAGASVPIGVQMNTLQLVVPWVGTLMVVGKAHNQMDALVQQLPPKQLLPFLRAAVRAASVLHGPLLNRGARGLQQGGACLCD